MKRKEISTTENTERTEVDAVGSGRSVANTEDLPDGFQMTELGPLPKEWRVVRLGEVVAEIVSGDWGQESPSRDSVKAYVLRGTDFEGAAQNDLTGTPIRYLRASSIERRKVCPGDLLVELSGGSKDQPTGRVLLIQESLIKGAKYPICFTNFVKRLKLHGCADPEYTAYWWQKLYISGVTRTYEKRTTGIRNFKLPDFLGNEKIALPPLPEQRAIAHVLRTVQRAKEATEGVIAALKELKKSLMQHLFTYGPIPVTEREQVELQESEIGPLPAHWRVVRLGEVAEKPQYGFTAAAQRDPVGPKMLRITDIQDGNVNWNAVPYCECGIEDIPKYLLEAGDILFARTGSVGKAFLVSSVPEPSIFASYLIRVRVDRAKLDPQFAFLFMQSSAYWSQITSQTHGAVQPNVNATQLRSLLLPLPPLDEQREIARILQAVDVKIAAEQARRAALEEVFKTLLHQLMTGQIRVSNITGAQQSGDPATGIGPFPQSED
jgi:type I restriction enzyme S subunit